MAVHNKEQAALAAAALPDDRAALLAEADAAEAATSRYDAAVWKLNGDMFSGCIDSSNPEAGGTLFLQPSSGVDHHAESGQGVQCPRRRE
jgi:hypothetical protein